MKKYKVRITSAPKMNHGGYFPRYAQGADVPGLNEFDYGMMSDLDPTRGSLVGSVSLAPTDANYPLTVTAPPTARAARPSSESLYDYVQATTGDGSYAARAAMAKKMGITGYKGTAAQNQQMLKMLKASKQGQGVVTKAPNGQVQATPAADPSAPYMPMGDRIPSATYGDNWDNAPTLWESAINGPVFRPMPYSKPLPGKKEAAKKAWKRNSVPGDQYQDGWDDTPQVWTPKNMFPKGATFPATGQPATNWKQTMFPGSYYEDGWGHQNSPYAPKNVMGRTFAYGGQNGYGLDINRKRSYVDMPEDPAASVRRTVAPVDPEAATYEAEKGEVIVGDFDKDGQNESGVFGGKRHSQGGTPAKEEGFIYSDTKALRMKGPIVEEFGKSAGKKQYTPAQLAKQYDLTKYKAVMDDPNADPYAKRTAEMMLENYEKKLGKLALVQESMKGFPQGVPDIAKKYLGEEQEEQAPMEAGEAAYGGYYAMGGLPMMQTAGQTKKAAARFPVFSQDYLDALNKLKGTVDVALPVNATGAPDRFTLPELQAQQGKTGVYGDENWFDPEHQADFKKRQAWYTDNAPGWNPSMPGATIAFQQAYDAEAVRRGLKPYFQGQKFQQRDGKFGEYTFSAPGFADRPVTTTTQTGTPATGTPATGAPSTGTPAKEETTTTYERQTGEDPNYVGPRKRLPYNALDVANLFQAVSTPVKSYAPRMFLPDIQEAQGYYDQANYNPMLASANTRMAMNNTFGSSQAAMAANSYNPELLQGIQSETQRVAANNLQTANQFGQYNNQLRNNASAMNNQLAQDNYDKWVKTQEETDIANKLKWRKDVMPAAQNMVNNRANMERFNAMYPQYQVTGPMWDPTFVGGKNNGDKVAGVPGKYGMNEFFTEYPEYKDLYEKGDNKEKLQVLNMMQARAREYRSLYTKNPKNMAANVANYQTSGFPGMYPGMYPGAMGPNGEVE